MSSPVLEAVEAGHFQKSGGGEELSCRADGEPWPCTAIKVARAKVHQSDVRRARSNRC